MPHLCREVEQYFISNYWLNIPYEREYWIGLAYMPGTAPRKYNWTDKGDDLGKQAYQNWGTGEPNNQAGNENCGVANYSMRTGQQTSGWQDMACSRRFPFICRIKRELPGLCCSLMPASNRPGHPAAWMVATQCCQSCSQTA